MTIVNVYEAKTHLSRLIEQAAGGEDVIIARNGKPVARLTELEEHENPIRFGVLKGKLKVPDDFDAPLEDAIIRGFEEG
jgi:prevent-host-death family protein